MSDRISVRALVAGERHIDQYHGSPDRDYLTIELLAGILEELILARESRETSAKPPAPHYNLKEKP